MTLVNKLARPLLAAPFIATGLDALTKPEGHREPARKLWALAQKFGIDEKLGISNQLMPHSIWSPAHPAQL